MESFKHLYAKELLCEWLRDSAKNAKNGEAHFGDFKWNVDGEPPDYGVYAEYPVAEVLLAAPLIDDWTRLPICGLSQPPTRDELRHLGHKPKVVFDVAIRDKGVIMYGFEVVHKSPPSIEKIFYLSEIYCAVFQVRADWILSQINKPAHICAYEPFGGLARWIHEGRWVKVSAEDFGLRDFKNAKSTRGGVA